MIINFIKWFIFVVCLNYATVVAKSATVPSVPINNATLTALRLSPLPDYIVPSDKWGPVPVPVKVNKDGSIWGSVMLYAPNSYGVLKSNGCNISTSGDYISVTFKELPNNCYASVSGYGIAVEFSLVSITEYNSYQDYYIGGSTAMVNTSPMFVQDLRVDNPVNPVYIVGMENISNISYRAGDIAPDTTTPKYKKAKFRPHWPYPPKPTCKLVSTTVPSGKDEGWRIKAGGIEAGPTRTDTMTFTIKRDSSVTLPGEIVRLGNSGEATVVLGLTETCTYKNLIRWVDYYESSKYGNTCKWKYLSTKRCEGRQLCRTYSWSPLVQTFWSKIVKLLGFDPTLPTPTCVFDPPFIEETDCITVYNQ